MQLKVFSCVSWGLILALWNALKPYSATGLHAWSHTGGVPPRPPQECVLYKMPQERARFDLGFVELHVAISSLFLSDLYCWGRENGLLGLTSWLYSVWCFLVFLSLSHVVSWVGCGTWLYRFLIYYLLPSFKLQSLFLVCDFVCVILFLPCCSMDWLVYGLWLWHVLVMLICLCKNDKLRSI